MPKILLTTKLLKTLIAEQLVRKVDYFDVGCKGLQLEIRPHGATWYFRYRDDYSRVRQYKICPVEDLNLMQVRKRVDQLRGDLASGNDPARDKDQRKRGILFGDFIRDRYMPYVKTYKRSWNTDESLLRNYLLPRFADKKMGEINRKDIIEMHQSRRAQGGSANSANRLLIIMRYCYNLAIDWEVCECKNPTIGVPLFEENNKRERFLTQDEVKLLYEELKKSQNSMLQYIIPMLILTGARKSEVLNARWEEFKLASSQWKIPISKSGKARFVPLSSRVVDLLNTMPKIIGNPYVFPNPHTGRPYVSIYYPWHTARVNCGLTDVRIHDLRHSFASFLINAGRSLYEVQKILGHTQMTTTQRYAHLTEATLVDAANSAAKVLD